MSNNSTSENPATHIPPISAEDYAAIMCDRPNFVVRGFRKIKNIPPATAFAVLGGVALIAAGAMLGRNSGPAIMEVVDITDIDAMLLAKDSTEADDTVA